MNMAVVKDIRVKSGRVFVDAGFKLVQREREWLLTITHGHGKSLVIELDVVDLQDIHEELEVKSACCCK